MLPLLLMYTRLVAPTPSSRRRLTTVIQADAEEALQCLAEGSWLCVSY